LIRTIIIDDELNARTIVGDIVKLMPDKFVIIDEASDIKSAKIAIAKHNPDLVLLDIDLPDGNAFKLLQELGAINFKIIFITAYSEFAVQAFKFSALDYILKPVVSSDLTLALEKVNKRVELEEMKIKLNNLLLNINNHPAKKKLVLKSANSIISVDIADIFFCESEGGSYTRFHFAEKKEILVSKALKEFDNLLCKFNFFRVHKSYLVNLDKIIRFDKHDGGSIVLTNKIEIPVSLRKRESFLERFAAL
jgi:two-component system LytT family response regulator